MRGDLLWSFRTARFVVELRAEPEDMNPADQLDAEAVQAIDAGEVEWFRAAVRVYCDGLEVGSDTLGGCAYAPGEFETSHRDPGPMNRNCSLMRAARGGNVRICHYFPGMVGEAIAMARTTIAHIPRLRRIAAETAVAARIDRLQREHASC